jgi:hypothetical protein
MLSGIFYNYDSFITFSIKNYKNELKKYFSRLNEL